MIDLNGTLILSIISLGLLGFVLIRYQTVLLGFTFLLIFGIASASLSAFLFGALWGLNSYWITSAHLRVFTYSALGLMAFAGGVALAWRPLRATRGGIPGGAQRLSWLNPRFAWLCTLLGAAAYGVWPITHAIPTLQVIGSAYLQLLPFGVVIALAYARTTGEYRPFRRCLAVFIPVVLLQMIRTGHVGAGGTFLVQLLFVACFWRRVNVRTAVMFLFGMVILSSLLFSWLESRYFIRQDLLLHTGPYARLVEFLEEFNYVDPLSLTPESVQKHLFDRVDMSRILAAQVRYQPDYEPFAYGKTVATDLLAAFVPRTLWPDKPIRVGGSEFVSRYTGLYFAPGTSVGLPYQFELYANGGALWVVIGFFLIGWLTARLELALFSTDLTLPQFMSLLITTKAVTTSEQTIITIVMAVLGGVVGYFILGMLLQVLNEDWQFWESQTPHMATSSREGWQSIEGYTVVAEGSE